MAPNKVTGPCTGITQLHKSHSIGQCYGSYGTHVTLYKEIYIVTLASADMSHTFSIIWCSKRPVILNLKTSPVPV